MNETEFDTKEYWKQKYLESRIDDDWDKYMLLVMLYKYINWDFNY